MKTVANTAFAKSYTKLLQTFWGLFQVEFDTPKAFASYKVYPRGLRRTHCYDDNPFFE